MADDDLPQFDLNSPEYQAKMRAQRRANQARREREAEETRKRFELGKENMLKADFAAWPMESQYNVKDMTFNVTMTEPKLGAVAENAKSRADKEFRRGIRNYSTNYRMGPATVKINVYGRNAMIHIGTEDVLAFEFATSGKPIKKVDAAFSTHMGVTESYDYVTVIVDAIKRDSSIQTSARISGLRRILYNEEHGLPYEPLSLINAGRQIQGLNEPRYYPFEEDNLGHLQTPTITGVAYDPPDSWEGALFRSTMVPVSNWDWCTPGNGAGGINHGKDVDYDSPWWISENAGAMQYAHFPIPDTDWPRAGGLQEIETQWGKRRFGVMIDSTDGITVFAVGALQVWSGDWDVSNIDSQYVRSLAPTYPSWAWRGSGQHAHEVVVPTYLAEGESAAIEEWRLKLPQHKWSFNHDGTKACAVMFQHLPYENDTAFFAADADANTPWLQTYFDTYIKSMSDDWGGGFQRGNVAPSFVAPGLVEVTINISVSGPDLDDFSAAATVTSVRAPLNMPYPTIVAGYAWMDFTCNGKSIRKGDMLTLDLLCYTRSQRKIDGTHELKSADKTCLWVLRNITQDNSDVFTILSDSKNYTLMRLIDYDIRYVSFMFMSQWLRIYPSGQGVRHPAIVPIVHGRVQSLIFPETMEEENKQVLRNFVNLNGYDTIQNTRNPEYTFNSLNPDYDLYSEAKVTGIVNLREMWGYDWQNSDYDYYVFPTIEDSAIYNYYGAYGMRFKHNSNPTLEPTWTAAGKEMMGVLYLIDSHWRAMFICKEPKFGWNSYAYIVAEHLATNSWTTFTVHPGGTWALWTDIYMYDKNGLPYSWNGFAYTNAWTVGTLGAYDAALIEHWIIDRVHLEFQTDRKTTGEFDTTFLGEYNKAVRKARDNPDPDLRLKGDIQELTLPEMRATFTKTSMTKPFLGPSAQMLSLYGNWFGDEGWMYEPLVHNGVGGITIGNYGALEFPNTLGPWAPLQAISGSGYYITPFGIHGQWCKQDVYKFRFYDPTIIMTRR